MFLSQTNLQNYAKCNTTFTEIHANHKRPPGRCMYQNVILWCASLLYGCYHGPELLSGLLCRKKCHFATLLQGVSIPIEHENTVQLMAQMKACSCNISTKGIPLQQKFSYFLFANQGQILYQDHISPDGGESPYSRGGTRLCVHIVFVTRMASKNVNEKIKTQASSPPFVEVLLILSGGCSFLTFCQLEVRTSILQQLKVQ